ncbi:uncharacterized protein LOC114451881 isoform X2 [Parambassis ranga]|uniref:Uncharacterized protein LOC114451881 isoform X2 n=1 Tax=Parambassis ranga TaxID=210632 RepID=A0A6P7KEC1_9TELE|nr:uncharacterized protein LOC114451881 isoform X2 [Parambassis ranga]
MDCQVCLIRCDRMVQFKTHMRSPLHQQKCKEVFPEGVFKSKSGFLPYVVFMDSLGQEKITDPIVGMSMLSLCFCPESRISFYLCHVCEEVCPPSTIISHITSGSHYVNYSNYTDPNILFYAWIPSNSNMGFLRRNAKWMSKNERGNLKMLHLPENLINQLHSSGSYSKVMSVLSGNEKLLKQIKASQPKRTMIQTYLKNKSKSHPLVGMQHIVECICAGPHEKRHYLCTLCKLTVTTNQIIKHVLSFDHIHWFFKEWHPSTLRPKGCYKEGSATFSSMIVDLSQQANKIHEAESNDMKEVNLQPAEFDSVNFTSYTEALTKLESIKKLNLTTSIKPGNKLVSLYPGLLILQCQNCGFSFLTISQYVQHLSERKHNKMLRKFGQCFDSCNKAGFHSGMYSLIKDNCSSQKLPVGTSLVVTCASTRVQTENFCVCFACEDSFQESYLKQHLNSQKHLIYTLLHLNPWRLPFAWKNLPDNSVLRTMALEEERKGGGTDMTLMVFDIPSAIYCNLYSATFATVVKRLPYKVLSRGVPESETYTKLQQKEKFPLLGCHFMVKYINTDEKVGYLCLLCKRKLLVGEWCAHAFSLEHVKTFLTCFHPDSLNSSTDNTEGLLDLAKQAMCFHKTSHVQTIQLYRPIWEPCDYNTLKHILASVKRRESAEKLEPPIVPQGKLVPRGTLKEVHKDSVRDSSLENSADNEGNGQTVEKKDKETPTQSDKETNRGISEIQGLDEKKNSGETCKITPKTEPSGEIPKPAQKRPRSTSEKPQEDIPPEEEEDAEREIGHKRQRLSFKVPCEEPPEVSSSEQTESTTADMEHQTATAGLEKGSLFECRCDKHDTMYFCMSCSMKLTKTEVVGHVAGPGHHEVTPVIVNVDEEVYSIISKQSFKSAIQTLKAQPLCGWTCSSASAPFGGKAGDTSVSLHYQHSAFGKDKMEVVKMNISDNDSDDSTAVASMPAITNTTEVTCESNKDGTRTHVKVSAGTTHTGLTVSRGRNDTSSLCSQVASRMHKTTVTEASANTADVKNSVGSKANAAPHSNKNKRPAAPHPATATTMPAMPEHKKPTKEPSHTSTKPRDKLPVVGVNQLIKVKCGDKRQVYCQLCSVKLNESSHVSDEAHQYKYVKMVYPGWSAKPSEMESKFKRTVIELGEKEKDRSHTKEVEVTSEVYKELAALPQEKAIEKLKEMLRQKRTREAVISSPCEVTSSDDTHNPSEQQNKKQDQLLAQILVENPNGGRYKLSDPRSARTEQPNQSNTRDNLPVPSSLSASKEPPRISLGVKSKDSSHLFWYLKVKVLDSKIIIGMNYVWECRGVSLDPFYLCESCEETISLSDICHHMVGQDHQVCYLKKWQSQFLWPFQQSDLPLQMKLTFFNVITRMLSMRESFHKADAQVILLQQELYESVRKSSFSEALNKVKRIKQQQNGGCSAVNEPQQELIKHMEEFLSTQVWPFETQAPDQESHNATHKTEKPHEEEATVQLDRVTERSVNCSVPKADCAVESWSNISLHPELTQPKPMETPQIEVNETAVHSSFFTANQDISQNPTLSSKDKNPPTRKMSADTSAETLGLLQPLAEGSSELTAVNPAVSPLLPFPAEKEPRSDKQKTFSVDLQSFARVISHFIGKTTQSKAPDNAECNDSAASKLLERTESTCNSVSSVAATTADPKPQQSVLEEVSQSISSSAATDPNPGQTWQLHSNTQTDGIRDDQLPINTIVTSRKHLKNHNFMGSYIRQDLTEGNTATQANFSAVPSLPSDTPAAPYSRMANVPGQYPGYLYSESVKGYTATATCTAYTGSSYPPVSTTTRECYTNQVYQPQWPNYFGVQSYMGGFAAAMPLVSVSPATPQIQPMQQVQQSEQVQQMQDYS